MQNTKEESENGKEPRFQTQTINGLVILFYKNLLLGSPKQYTVAYSICWALAKRFKEKEHIETLEKLYKNSNIGFPLGVIQAVVYRDTVIGWRLSKTYNYGPHSKMVQLGDLIEALDNCMARFLDIFTEICVKHDIDTNIVPMPDLQALLKPDQAGGL